MKKLLEASRAAIDLKGTYFQEALSVACEKMDLPGLAPSGKTGDGKETFQLPDISRRLDIDGSWSATLDVLRKPPVTVSGMISGAVVRPSAPSFLKRRIRSTKA